VRPPAGSPTPERTLEQYCTYDDLNQNPNGICAWTSAIAGILDGLALLLGHVVVAAVLNGQSVAGNELLLVVQEQRLCLPTDDDSAGLLLLRVSVLDLVAEPEENSRFARTGSLSSNHRSRTHVASSHRFGSPSTG
jgi:hypothetical protein